MSNQKGRQLKFMVPQPTNRYAYTRLSCVLPLSHQSSVLGELEKRKEANGRRGRPSKNGYGFAVSQTFGTRKCSTKIHVESLLDFTCTEYTYQCMSYFVPFIELTLHSCLYLYPNFIYVFACSMPMWCMCLVVS